MTHHGDDQFRCVFIAVASPQQKEIYNRCFEKWEKKNLISAATQMDSANTASTTVVTSTTFNEPMEGDSRAHHGDGLVFVNPPQVDEVTLARWLDPSNLDDGDPWNDW